MLAGSPLHARQPVSRLGRTTRVPHPAPPAPAPTYAHTLCTLHPHPLTSLPLRLCCIRPGARHAAVVKHQRLQRQLQQQQQRLATVQAQADEAEQQHHSLQSQVQDVHTKRLRGKTTINAAVISTCGPNHSLTLIAHSRARPCRQADGGARGSHGGPSAGAARATPLCQRQPHWRACSHCSSSTCGRNTLCDVHYKQRWYSSLDWQHQPSAWPAEVTTQSQHAHRSPAATPASGYRCALDSSFIICFPALASELHFIFHPRLCDPDSVHRSAGRHAGISGHPVCSTSDCCCCACLLQCRPSADGASVAGSASQAPAQRQRRRR